LYHDFAGVDLLIDVLVVKRCYIR